MGGWEGGRASGWVGGCAWTHVSGFKHMAQTVHLVEGLCKRSLESATCTGYVGTCLLKLGSFPAGILQLVAAYASFDMGLAAV